MNPTTLWMRHGTCLDGLRRPTAHTRPNSPLTGAGADEAELAAREMRKRNCRPVIIASSPLRRARQTATLVAATLDAHLTEPISAFAEWQAPHCVLGRTPDEYPTDYIAWRELGHPGLVGGSDTWKSEGLWRHRGSTRLSCGNGRFGWFLSYVNRRVSGQA